MKKSQNLSGIFIFQRLIESVSRREWHPIRESCSLSPFFGLDKTMKLGMRADNVTIVTMFLVSVAISIIGAWALFRAYHAIVTPVVADPMVFLPTYRNQIRPEPDERFVFTALVGAVSVICLFGAFVTERTRRVTRRKRIVDGFLAAAGFLVFVVPMVGFEFSTWLLTKNPVAPNYTWLLIGLLLLSTSYYWLVGIRDDAHLSARKLDVLVALPFAIAMLLQIAAWRVVSARSLFHDNTWNVHFEAVIYAVSQVVMGKTLLSDLPSQYGLFPEIMAPIFKVIGLSTLSFTTVCAVMQLVSMACIWWVLHRAVRDITLKVVASIALVMLTFETVMYFIGIHERYFQYWPVRFFWPAVSAFAFYRYSRNRTATNAAVVSGVGAVGTLWNTDSGVMIILAFGAFLILSLIGSFADKGADPARRRFLWKAIATHGLITILVVSCFYLYLSWKSSGPVHLSWIYEYQITFYKLGFTMLSMPTHPSSWMTVMAVYLMGIIVGFLSIAKGRQSWCVSNILFLSMLGIGLFVYYQGRSHILNLITVSWPAVVVGALLSDRMLRGVRAGVASKEFLVLPSAGLGIMAFCAVPFVVGIPKLFDDSVALFKSRHEVVSDVVQDEINFIRDHSRPGATCAILSVRQGIYYAEAKLVSPISGPGYIETVLQADRDGMLIQLQSLRPRCVFIGVGASAIDLGPDIGIAMKGYHLIATNKSGTMQYLTP